MTDLRKIVQIIVMKNNSLVFRFTEPLFYSRETSSPLILSTLGKNFSRRHFKKVFLFFSENRRKTIGMQCRSVLVGVHYLNVTVKTHVKVVDLQGKPQSQKRM